MSRSAALSRPQSPARRPFLVWAGRLLALHRIRRALAELDAERLRDIGLSHGDARREADRPLWDAPAHWMK